MLWFIIEIILITYLIVFVFRSLAKHWFEQYGNKYLSNIIDNFALSWVKVNPLDNWILVDQKNIREKNTDEFPGRELESEVDMEQNKNKTTLLQKIWGDNSSVLEIMIYGIISIAYIKYMWGWGKLLELSFGIIVGASFHLLHLIRVLIAYGNSYILGKTVDIKIKEILEKNSKYHPYILSLMSLLCTGLVVTLKTTYYSRLIGEWFFDMSSLWFFFSQIIGYIIVLNFIKTINLSSDSPYIIVLMIIYTVLIFTFL